jgi:predicted GNAT family N-acyltransferase
MKEYITYGVDSEETYDDEGELAAEVDYWLISKVYVPVDKRGNGIARKLMTDAIADMKKERPELDIKLWCEAQDEDTDSDLLQGFYESLGFDATGNGAEMVLN